MAALIAITIIGTEKKKPQKSLRGCSFRLESYFGISVPKIGLFQELTSEDVLLI